MIDSKKQQGAGKKTKSTNKVSTRPSCTEAINYTKSPEEPAPNKTGRPPKYKSAEQMQAVIDEYLDDIEIKPTICGLCYHLGFASRQSFYAYEKKEAFSYTVKRARLFLEGYYEGKLVANNCTGSIFALKNFGWKDRTEHSLDVSPELKTVLGLINGSTKGKLPAGDSADSSEAS